MKSLINIVLLTATMTLPTLAGSGVKKIGSALPNIDLISAAMIGDKLILGGDAGVFLQMDTEGNISGPDKVNARDDLGKYAMIESISEYGLAVGLGASVFRFEGNTWNELNFQYNSSLRSVYSIDNDTAIITATEGKFYTTVDGGDTWTENQAPHPYAINSAIKTDKGILLCGESGLMVSSGDFFETFTSSTHNIPGNILAVSRPDVNMDQYLFFTQEGEIFLYSGLDSSYSMVYENPEFTFTDWAQNGGTIISTGSDSAIVMSNDAGKTWTVVNHDYGVFLFSVEYFNGKFILAGKDAHIVSFENGIFKRIAPNSTYDFHCATLYNNMIYAGTFDGKVVSTANRGLTWTEGIAISDQVIVGIEADSTGILLFATSGGSIYHYVPGTEKFEKVQAGIFEDGYQGLFYTGGSYYVVSRYGNIYKRTDNENWQEVHHSADSTSITNLLIDDESGSGFAIGDKGKILNTINRGMSWNNMEDIGDLPFFGLSRVNNRWLIGGMYGSFFYSGNETDWQADLSDFPNGESYTKLSTSPDESTILAISILGLVLSSEDMGANWDTLANGYTLMTDIVWMDNNTAYVFGHESSMYEVGLEAVRVEELTKEAHFHIYPVPATDKLFVEIRNSNLDIREFNVTDINGRLIISSSPINKQSFEIDISGISAGVYFLTLLSHNEASTHKFVVK